MDEQDRRALRWLKTWSRHRITELKRRRKHTPHQAKMPPGELEVLTALFDLEDAARRLIDDDDALPGALPKGIGQS
jgi:hypothetical protein